MRTQFVIAFIAAALVFLTLPLSVSAQQSINYDDVALLRWYPANLTARIPAGQNPIAAAFDGSHIWVANYTSGSVTELEASDGAIVGTFSAGANPIGLAFDGANLW